VILALADDLTGALETGAKFAAAGIRALVTTLPAVEPMAEVLVVDTETRHQQPADAAAMVYALVLAARRGGGVSLIYKKTDSTLRGNIGSELGALMAAWPGVPLIYAAAYPRLGRSVRGGALRVDGVPVAETAFARDPLNPIRESYIPRLLSPYCGAIRPVAPAALAGPLEAAVYVVDGESEADIEAAARAAVRQEHPLAAGPAALAEWIARLVEAPREAPLPLPRMARALVINGSLHELSLRQVACARAAGWETATPSSLARRWSPSRWLILDCPAAPDTDPLEHSRQLGRTVAGVLERAVPDALVVFGGDTAYGILAALDCTQLRPLREVLPGVPISRCAARGRDFWLVTKAGGFGSAGVLPELREMLSW
jgi:uncharacterized protein YgbK (DUF1537 family)